jgi:hypothetical protein
MRFRYSLVFLVGLLGGGLTATLAHHHPLAHAPAPAPGAQAPAPLPRDPQAGERDPRADLEGQMMLDPMTRTYLGG